MAVSRLCGEIFKGTLFLFAFAVKFWYDNNVKSEAEMFYIISVFLHKKIFGGSMPVSAWTMGL